MATSYSPSVYSKRRTPSVIAIRGHPIYLMLDHFPISCFTLTLLTDILYWQTSDLLWKHFSEWLLLFGLVLGAAAFLVLLIDVVFTQALRATGYGWPYVFGLVVVLALATLNSLRHASDGWVGVVPWGLTLSVLTFLAVIITAWIGREMAYRSMNGVNLDDQSYP